jgi:hypothetical protein
MLIGKRLTIWLLETLSAVFLIGLGWFLVAGYDKTRGIGKELLFAVTAIGVFAFSTGYLFTTAVCRAIWRDLRPWSYPIIATVLFLIHSQVFFVSFRSSSEPQELSFQIPGGLTVFACTYLGSRRWVSADNKLAVHAPTGTTARTNIKARY